MGEAAASHVLPTTVVGSYPQPDWLIDRDRLKGVPRTLLRDAWRLTGDDLEAAQDAATIVAIHEQERAGIDIVTDGEIRRESYSNHFANALSGIADTDGVVETAGRKIAVPDFDGDVERLRPVEADAARFLVEHATHVRKVTLPGPFTMSQQAVSSHYPDTRALATALADAVNAEVKDLFAAGVDIVQLDEPWMQRFPDDAGAFGVEVLKRALDGVEGTVALHMCFGYAAAVGPDKPNRYAVLEELEDAPVEHVSIEAAQPDLDLSSLSGILPSKRLVVGVLDLADPAVEPVETLVGRIERALDVVGPERLIVGPDCGMKFLPPATAFGKLRAMAEATAQVRTRLRG